MEPLPKLSLNHEDSATCNVNQLRDALISSHEFFHAIVNDSEDGIIVLTQDGMICFANPAAEKMLGRQFEELLGANFGIPLIAGKTTEINLMAESDALHVAEMRVVATQWQKQAAYLATLRDITSHKQAEQDALRAVRRRDRFLAILSHELRTPLAAISNAAQVLVRENREAQSASPPAVPPLAPGLDEAAASSSAQSSVDERVQVIVRQCEQMRSVLDDLLNVSRISRGQIRLRRQPIDVLQVVRNAVESVAGEIELKQHQFHVELPDEPVVVDGDFVRLTQVVSNLLTNAVKYTENAGWIRLVVEVESDQVILRVQDDGTGIDPDMLQRVFEPFVQATNTLASLGTGLGVGLALVRDLVALHGGTIHVASEGAGRGSTFSISLPLATDEQVAMFELNRPPDAVAAPIDSTALAPPEEPPHVLLVEDVADVRNMLREVLELESFRVSTACDGREALDQIDASRPDVALVDIGLPGIDGYQVARQIRQNYGQTVFLIALTGYGQEEDIRRAQAAGFDRHLTKPVNCDSLVQIISERGRPAHMLKTSSAPLDTGLHPKP